MQSILPNPRKGELGAILPAKKEHSHHRFGTKSASAPVVGKRHSVILQSKLFAEANSKTLMNCGMYESKPETDVGMFK
jgi:hypothetical protein